MLILFVIFSFVIAVILRLDWQAIDFGHQVNSSVGSTSVYSSGVSNFYMRVYRANPPSDSFGDKEERISLCVGVPEDIKERLHKLLESAVGAEWPDSVLL
jgi:hypothetical protein